MRVTEIINRNALTNRLLERGYNVYLPIIDQGIDLIAHRESNHDLGADTKLVQQKSRWTIDRKYLGRSLWVAFPDRDEWYLIPHDEMVDWPEVARFLQTSSWTEAGSYHMARMSSDLLSRAAPYRL